MFNKKIFLIFLFAEITACTLSVLTGLSTRDKINTEACVSTEAAEQTVDEISQGTKLQGDENYEIVESKDDEGNSIYTVNIYNDDLLLFSDYYYPLVTAEYINDSVIQFHFGTGNPGPKYDFYYDTVSKQLSDLYYDSKLLDDKTLYYIEYVYKDGDSYEDAIKRLIVRDIFNNQKLYICEIRDFTWGWNPTEVISDINYEDGLLYLKYLSGKDEEVVCENIDIYETEK